MKRPGVDGGFLLCFGLNLIFNAFWALPGVILLVAHFIIGIPLWPALVAFGLWIAAILGITIFMSWATSTSNSNGAGTGTRGRATVRYSSQHRTEHIDPPTHNQNNDKPSL